MEMSGLRLISFMNRVFLVCLVGVWGGAVSIASGVALSDQADLPLLITSEKVTIQSRKNHLHFEGNVVLTKGDLRMASDSAELFSVPKSLQETRRTPVQNAPVPWVAPAEKGGRDVHRIEVVGRVRIDQGERHARAQKGVYDKTAGTVVLTGDAEAWDGQYHIQGERITFVITEEKFLVEKGHLVVRQEAGVANPTKK